MKKAVVLLLIVGAIFYLWSQNRVEVPETTDSLQREEKVVESTEFEEMTIPYLRSRKYVSKLGDLKEYATKPNYTSYLTSFNSDTFKVNGLLTMPKGDKPVGGWPAIVFVHGYIAPTVYRTTEKYGDYVDYLARNGFVVFKIDLRGHGDSEGDPGGSYYSSDYIIDTLNARSALQASDFVNPSSIGLWGHSMAGNVTFRSFAVAQDIPALIVWAGAGYSYDDLLKYGLNDGSYRPPSTTAVRQQRRNQLRAKYGDFSKNSEFWGKVTPVNYLKDVKGAIQVHHAVDDAVVNVGYGRDLMTILDNTEIPHSLYEYPSGGHNISGSSFSQAMARTVEFYNSRLKR